MNKLEKVILDQHNRVKAADNNGHKVLGEVKGEILSVATPEGVQDILSKTLDVASLSIDPASSHLAGANDLHSVPRRLASLGGTLHQFSDSGLVVPEQGYVGLIGLDASGRASDVFGFSVARGQELQEDDPIQEACGPDFFYPPMMWAKALYSEAYKNRPESQKNLPIHTWLAELVEEGLFQGSKPTQHGLLGATGFIPSVELMAKLNDTQALKEQIESEQVQEFRASGLMDQAALTHLAYEGDIGLEDVEFMAKSIIEARGSLN
jgi:hypothetical protein